MGEIPQTPLLVLGGRLLHISQRFYNCALGSKCRTCTENFSRLCPKAGEELANVQTDDICGPPPRTLSVTQPHDGKSPCVNVHPRMALGADYALEWGGGFSLLAPRGPITPSGTSIFYTTQGSLRSPWDNCLTFSKGGRKLKVSHSHLFHSHMETFTYKPRKNLPVVERWCLFRDCIYHTWFALGRVLR